MAVDGDEDGSTFYRSARTRALNDEYGDMLHKILDLEACAHALPDCDLLMCRSRYGCHGTYAACGHRLFFASGLRCTHACLCYCNRQTCAHVIRGYARMHPPEDVEA